LKDAVNGYFAGTEIKAIVAAVHIRTLVHDTDRSDAFLATIDPNFKKLDIYRKRQPSSKAVFWMPVGCPDDWRRHYRELSEKILSRAYMNLFRWSVGGSTRTWS